MIRQEELDVPVPVLVCLSEKKYYKGDKDFRGVNLVATVLKQHDLDVAKAKEAYRIIQSHNPKNLKAIKADFDKKFGKNPPQGYYKALRPLFRVIKVK